MAGMEKQCAKTFVQLRRCAQERGPCRVAVVVADDDVARAAAVRAHELGIAVPVLVGNVVKIRSKASEMELAGLLDSAELLEAENAAAAAVQMARAGEVDVLLKGH